MEEEINEMNQLLEYMQSVDITEWPISDQLAMMQAQLTMLNTIKPILLKHMMADESISEGSTFMFRMKGDVDDGERNERS